MVSRTAVLLMVGGVLVTARAHGQVASPNECDQPRPTWVFCDDFEADRLDRYFEYDDARGAFVRAEGVGTAGSWGMRARFEAGTAGAGALHLALGRTPQRVFRPADAGTQVYRELYWRFFVRNQPGWQGGGGYKLTRAFVFASESTWAQAMIAHVWAGQPPHQQVLVMDPASGVAADGTLRSTRYNDFARLRWLGARRGRTPLFAADHVGAWYCVEVHVRLDDPGRGNGIFEFWVDGRLEALRNDLAWVGPFNRYGINAVYLENYWNNGAPVRQERYFDRFVVATARIGC
jgi:hypothetical protein